MDQQEWTLEQKALYLEQEVLLPRHSRLGLTSECRLLEYGNPAAGCIQGDSDNNGLWTAIVVVAAYFRYATTSSPSAASTASRFLGGLELLNAVTGRRGLMARSCCDPASWNNHSCGYETWIHDKTRPWYNSTATDPRLRGYRWKGDTSSDETTGHVFALAVAASLSPAPEERARARRLLVDFVRGVVESGFDLIDVTGEPTTWGRWDPATVNGDRAFSDERGLQSLQMLAYLAAAANVTANASSASSSSSSSSSSLSSSSSSSWVVDAYRKLTSEDGYDQNMLNLKITCPVDINYSDDELAFLPFYTWTAMRPLGAEQEEPFAWKPVRRALERTFGAVRPERSSLWNAVYYAAGGGGGNGSDANGGTGTVADDDPTTGSGSSLAGSLAEDALWNLRTWPLEMVQWPVRNAQRLDVRFAQDPTTRFGPRPRGLSSKAGGRPPLPANERAQYRWNAVSVCVCLFVLNE